MDIPNSVRLAMPAEAVDIARLQRHAWSKQTELAAAQSQLRADESVQAWHQAIVQPPLAQFRVLVAVGQGQVEGFVVTGPSPDDDAQPTTGAIGEFVVNEQSPAAEEHRSRLMNAAVDTLRKDGFELATMWLPTTADQLRAFLISCGWGPDGAHQTVSTHDEQIQLKLIRMHTDIRED